MIDKISKSLTNRIRNEMSDVDDERAEVIEYGLQILIGEIPKLFIMLGVAYILGIFKLSILTFFILLIYRGASGGFHLHTHIGCIVSTCIFYCGIALLSKYIILQDFAKYILIALVWIFGVWMVKLYAPADTEDVPILDKKTRKQKQILAYISLTIGLLIALFIKNPIIVNIIIFGYFLQTCTITKIAYRLTKNQYGYEVYENTSN